MSWFLVFFLCVTAWYTVQLRKEIFMMLLCHLKCYLNALFYMIWNYSALYQYKIWLYSQEASFKGLYLLYSFQVYQWLKMMSDASDMLAAALEQMDGIIAGKGTAASFPTLLPIYIIFYHELNNLRGHVVSLSVTVVSKYKSTKSLTNAKETFKSYQICI